MDILIEKRVVKIDDSVEVIEEENWPGTIFRLFVGQFSLNYDKPRNHGPTWIA